MSHEEMGSSELNKLLLGLVHRVNGAAGFQEAVCSLVEQAAGLLPCDGAAAMWLHGEHLEVLAVHGATAPPQGLTLPAGQIGIARVALDSGRSALVADTSLDPAWQEVPGEELVRTWLGVPLAAGEWTLGLLEWTALEAEAFCEEHILLAAEAARYTAPVLYRAKLLDDALRRLREQEDPHLYATASLDLGFALQPVVREALEFAEARHAFVFLSAEGSNRLQCIAASGECRDQLQRATLRGDGTLGGWRVPIARSSEGFSAGKTDREVMLGLGIEQTLILPLRVSGEQVGMLGVGENRRGGSFGRDAMRLMTHLASQASLIVESIYQERPAPDAYDYETVFRASPLGIAVLSVMGNIRFCNPALATLFSRADRSLVGRNLAELLVTEDGPHVSRALEEVVISGSRRQVDARIRSDQGAHRHLRFSLSPVSIPHEGGDSLVAIVEDITPLKILERERVEHLRQLREKHEQLQDLDQLKSRFVSNVSHELRTPLAVIKLYATLARKGRPEKQQHYLQTIEQETHRLETMVENILDLTRMDRHALRVSPEELEPEEIIGQILQVYQENATKRAIELRNLVRGPLPSIWADKNHLIQMLTNLVDNALKYTPRGGQVWVAARELDSGPDGARRLEIAVGDTGVGIAEEEQQQVFERFYRGKNNTPGSTGTGLGLAIVRELMAQHGGSVTLRSRLGEGSIFALEFPFLGDREVEEEGQD
jgi:PAS domain S-box-containing protein